MEIGLNNLGLKVQRRSTRMMEETGLLGLPYSERLRIIGLTTLAERRLRGDLIEVYKASLGSSQLSGVLNFSRSELNILSKQVFFFFFFW